MSFASVPYRTLRKIYRPLTGQPDGALRFLRKYTVRIHTFEICKNTVVPLLLNTKKVQQHGQRKTD